MLNTRVLKVILVVGFSCCTKFGVAFASRPVSAFRSMKDVVKNEFSSPGEMSPFPIESRSSSLNARKVLSIRGGSSNCIGSYFGKIGGWYAAQLSANPILTKSTTAALIFAASDISAQSLEMKGKEGEENKRDITRTIVSGLVGLLYFGPAAHLWYDMIFKVFPGVGLVSTIKKATLGQLIFGPSFTCVFFAISLLQSGSFTLMNFVNKVKSDLPPAWRAGLGFWPLVDLVSYSMIPPAYIPLFVNFCSFCWTIYLSIIANRSITPEDS